MWPKVQWVGNGNTALNWSLQRLLSTSGTSTFCCTEGYALSTLFAPRERKDDIFKKENMNISFRAKQKHFREFPSIFFYPCHLFLFFCKNILYSLINLLPTTVMWCPYFYSDFCKIRVRYQSFRSIWFRLFVIFGKAEQKIKKMLEIICIVAEVPNSVYHFFILPYPSRRPSNASPSRSGSGNRTVRRRRADRPCSP